MKLRINSIIELKQFNQMCTKLPEQSFATREKVCTDCKSLMGLFALDTSEPFNFEIVNAPQIAYEPFKVWEC